MIEGQRELDGSVVIEVPDGDPDEREPLTLDRAASRPESSARTVARIVWVCAVASGRVCDRVAREKSPNRNRSTTVRPTRPAARIRRVTRSTSPTITASIASADFGAPAERALRADRTPATADLHGPGIAVVGEGVQVPPGCSTEDRDQHGLGELSNLADRCDPALVQLGRRHRPNTPQPFNRKRMQKRELPAQEARPAGRRAWPRRSPPWPETWSSPHPR